jgi:hypothetical protein
MDGKPEKWKVGEKIIRKKREKVGENEKGL